MDEIRSDIVASLLTLSHELGRADRALAILGEGNTSARLSEDKFLVKASGSSLGTLREENLVECTAARLLALLDQQALSDEEIDAALMASRVGGERNRPSVEALFHAYCLTLENIRYVAHAHGAAANSLLCSPRAREFAERRIFPDEVVCCGSASVFVPYADPGFSLACEIRRCTETFIGKTREIPRVILLESHGIITIGPSPESVLAAMLMAEKSAAVWIGAASAGGPTFLSAADIRRIAGRTDEHHRQKAWTL
jgi:rhamnose utilization protein RhaD (predicted bifunctional aldolase and dehydrogenase)